MHRVPLFAMVYVMKGTHMFRDVQSKACLHGHVCVGNEWICAAVPRAGDTLPAPSAHDKLQALHNKSCRHTKIQPGTCLSKDALVWSAHVHLNTLIHTQMRVRTRSMLAAGCIPLPPLPRAHLLGLPPTAWSPPAASHTTHARPNALAHAALCQAASCQSSGSAWAACWAACTPP